MNKNYFLLAGLVLSLIFLIGQGCTTGEAKGGVQGKPAKCGNNVCEAKESCSTCLADCGQCDSCSDTDGGLNYAVRGMTAGYKNGNEYVHTDYCVDGATITEYSCNGPLESSSSISCGAVNTTACIDGICK